VCVCVCPRPHASRTCWQHLRASCRQMIALRCVCMFVCMRAKLSVTSCCYVLILGICMRTLHTPLHCVCTVGFKTLVFVCARYIYHCIFALCLHCRFKNFGIRLRTLHTPLHCVCTVGFKTLVFVCARYIHHCTVVLKFWYSFAHATYTIALCLHSSFKT